MTYQELCLQENGNFEFNELELDKKIFIKGNYIFNGDTLILNKGIKGREHKFQNELKLVMKEDKLYHIYKTKLSKLHFQLKRR